MAQLFFNNARGVLDADITAEDTTLHIAQSAGLPSALASGDWFLLTLYKDSRRYGEDHEVVKVTGVADNGDGTWTLTVERGVEMAALPHVMGERVESRLTAGTMERIDQPNTWSSITEKPTEFPPSAHDHDIEEVTGLTQALAGKAPSSHDHDIEEVTGLTQALAGKAPSSHDHDDRYYLKTEVDTQIGDIGTILDAINGEVI